MKDNEHLKNTDNSEQISTESRRNFLKKAGAFALYTPPAITMLMHPSHASIMKSPGGRHQHRYERHDDNKYYKKSMHSRDGGQRNGRHGSHHR